MRSPLTRRIPRELKGEWKKYVALFAILTITIGFVSGLFVANDSMEQAALNSFEKYNMENGHFSLKDEATSELIDSIEDEGIKTYKQFYKQVSEKAESSKESAEIRVFKIREDVNQACILEGELPTEKDEITIDRMHADNLGIKVGDTIKIGGKDMNVSGLLALPDYSTLYEDNSEIIFNAFTFDVAVVTDEGFDEINGSTTYQYAYQFDEPPVGDEEQKEKLDDLVEQLYIKAATSGNEVTEFLPEYLNQAIHFAPEDFGSDKAMGEVLLIVLIGVIAFIFAITETNTIINEASVIGTLRASGYTKGEMLRHYIAVPIIVTFISAVLGNVLGYSLFKKIVVFMYYNSYSLPTYETLWNVDAFIKTTVYPVILVVAINFAVISSKLQFSPLKFLRRDLTKSKRKKAIRLPKWKFLTRFRVRILLQNINGYFTLSLGITFVMVLLGFAIGLPATLKNYQDNAPSYMIADYQYVLKKPVDVSGNEITTKEKTAERYSSKGLLTVDGVHVDEEITAYGYIEDSRYFDIPYDLGKDEVYVSIPFSEKFGLKVGDKLTLKEKYTSETYTFTIKDIYNQEGIMAIFMPNDRFNEIFDYDQEHFTGYLSEEKIDDIDEKYVYTIITIDDILELVKQLDHSMGGFADIFTYVCVILAMLLILLLTKIIIEKNQVSISMLKVLGYTNNEINSIFIRLTTIMVIISSVIGVQISRVVLNKMWENVMYDLSGWFHFFIGPKDMVKMIFVVIIAYLVVVLLDMRRIKKIPLTEALKSVE